MARRFEWDPRKAFSNAAKHSVTFVEAATVFSDPLSVTLPDLHHSLDEVRSATFGLSEWGHHLAVIHTDRLNAIRIISARRMTSRERRAYERGENHG